MKMLRKLLAALVLAVLCVCLFGGFTIPQEQDDGLVTVYSTDGRILELEPGAVEAYIKDGWSEDFSQVAATIWKPDGDSKMVLKGKVAGYVQQGWSASKEAVTVMMRDPNGNERDIFKDKAEEYKAKGWELVGSYVDPSKPAIALTFDDGPNPSTTNRLLDILEQSGAKATFFMLGNLVSGGPDCIKRMKELGMEIGSHTYDHTQLTKLSAEGVQSQVQRTNDNVNKIIGEKPTVMRPPYGAYNATVKAGAGVPIILWSVDTLDWKSRNADSVCEVVRKNVRDGSIILFHDIYGTSVDAVERLIPELQRQGYQLVTVSELAAAKGKEMEPGGVYTNF